jgi:hypothetical protein
VYSHRRERLTAAGVVAAFIREYEYCGELDTGLEDDRRLDDVLARGVERRGEICWSRRRQQCGSSWAGSA